MDASLSMTSSVSLYIIPRQIKENKKSIIEFSIKDLLCTHAHTSKYNNFNSNLEMRENGISFLLGNSDELGQCKGHWPLRQIMCAVPSPRTLLGAVGGLLSAFPPQTP